MESVTHRRAHAHRLLALAPGIEIWIDFAKPVEYESRLVAVDIAVRVARLQRVALDHEKRTAVELRGHRSAPCQQVEVRMAAPLRHYLRTLAAKHRLAVEHGYHRPVGPHSAPSHVDYRHISVGDLEFLRLIGQFPDLPASRG